jgi:hypothetical protein
VSDLLLREKEKVRNQNNNEKLVMDQIGKVKRRILLEPGKIYLVELMNGSKA